MKRGIKHPILLKEKIRSRCRSRSGETLAEVLVGILFVALASSLFLGMVTVSQRINTKTQKADDTFYKAMSQLECFEEDGELVHKTGGTVTVSVGENGKITQDYEAEIYYGDDMAAYRAGTWTEDMR